MSCRFSQYPGPSAVASSDILGHLNSEIPNSVSIFSVVLGDTHPFQLAIDRLIRSWHCHQQAVTSDVNADACGAKPVYGCNFKTLADFRILHFAAPYGTCW